MVPAITIADLSIIVKANPSRYSFHTSFTFAITILRNVADMILSLQDRARLKRFYLNSSNAVYMPEFT